MCLTRKLWMFWPLPSQLDINVILQSYFDPISTGACKCWLGSFQCRLYFPLPISPFAPPPPSASHSDSFFLWPNYIPKLHAGYSVLDSTVTAMAATLVCQRCKLTMLQQRWQWQRCNITMHTSLVVVTTNSLVTAMFALVWQQCAHHCESGEKWQRCHSTVRWHRCHHTNVHIVISALSLPLLSQRCHYNITTNTIAVTTCTPLWDSSCVVIGKHLITSISRNFKVIW